MDDPELNYDTGTYLLLTSDSYRAGGDREKRNQLGTGPLFIHFTRKFPSQVQEIDLVDRVDFDELDYLPSFAEYGTEVLPEATDIDVKFYKDQREMYQYVQAMLSSLQTQSPQDIGITVKHHSSEESDLQYVIFVQFLAEIPDPELLEITGRLFTAHVLSMLDSEKTIRFDFRTSGAILSSILPFPKNITVGALYSSETRSKRRIAPLQPYDVGELPSVICKEFAVVLDMPAFITEPGVLFLMNNIRPGHDSHRHRTIAQVRRSAGMPEVARRLAMLALESRGLKPKRKVTKGECMSLLGLTLEQYQSALFGPSRW